MIKDPGALSATGLLQPNPEGESIVQYPKKEAQRRELAFPQGIAGTPMVRITVQVLEEGAEPQIVKPMLRTGLIGAPGRKMATAAALAQLLGRTEALGMTAVLFMMMKIIIPLLDAVNQTNRGGGLILVFVTICVCKNFLDFLYGLTTLFP